METSSKLKLVAGLIGLSFLLDREARRAAVPQKVKSVKPIWERDTLIYTGPLDPPLPKDWYSRMGMRNSTEYIPEVPVHFIEEYVRAVFEMRPTPTQTERALTLDNIKNAYSKLKDRYEAGLRPPVTKTHWWQKHKEAPPLVLPIEPVEEISKEFIDRFFTRLTEIEDIAFAEWKKNFNIQNEVAKRNASAWLDSEACALCNTHIRVHNNACWAITNKEKEREEWIKEYGEPIPEVHQKPVSPDHICEAPIGFIADWLQALRDEGYIGRKLLKPDLMYKMIPEFRTWQYTQKKAKIQKDYTEYVENRNS